MALLLEDVYLPATLTAPPMTDEEFMEFVEEHDEFFFEMTAEGDLIVMPPRYTIIGVQNAEITGQLCNWATQDGRGLVTSPTTGFVLPNGARRSMDAAWTLRSEIKKQPGEGREGYWHLCPEFVVELLSPQDRLCTIRAKMVEYMENGAKLGWLIDPETRSVEIYRPGREPERVEHAKTIAGEGPVKGFVLDLHTVWDPFAD